MKNGNASIGAVRARFRNGEKAGTGERNVSRGCERPPIDSTVLLDTANGAECALGTDKTLIARRLDFPFVLS